MIRYVLWYRQCRIVITDADRPQTPSGTASGSARRVCPTHCPTRTVEEEQQELSKDSTPCAVPNTTFARAVYRALRACFALRKFTDHIQVVYVRNSAGKVDVYFDKGQGTLKIHRRWLDSDFMNHRSFCRPLVSYQLCRHYRAVFLLRWKSSWFSRHIPRLDQPK